jgi:hypothetical protein
LSIPNPEDENPLCPEIWHFFEHDRFWSISDFHIGMLNPYANTLKSELLPIPSILDKGCPTYKVQRASNVVI